MSKEQQPEALRLAEFFESMKKSSHRWYDGQPVHEKAASELRRLHAENEALKRELIKEAASTAAEKRRADQIAARILERAAIECEQSEAYRGSVFAQRIRALKPSQDQANTLEAEDNT